MMYRVCAVFFLFLAGVFYWRCTKEEGSGVVLAPQQCTAQNSEFQNQVPVVISGYSGQAMEPFIARDGSTLFFNSLNDGVDTSLYYAARVNDTEFTCGGKITGANGASTPHLDAVASMNEDGQFYFISIRNYPTSYKNVFTALFSLGGLAPTPAAVDGDFYIEQPGWIVMDAEVSPSGDNLYYVNAFFTGGSVPRSARIGVATWSAADSKFLKKTDSDLIMENVNRDGCLDYAPSISADGKELYFTRFCFGSGKPSILVAKRSSTAEAFGTPACIDVLKGYFVEAPSLSYDGKKMYYHRRDEGVFAIYMVTRP
jgi:hypothetical protein